MLKRAASPTATAAPTRMRPAHRRWSLIPDLSTVQARLLEALVAGRTLTYDPSTQRGALDGPPEFVGWRTINALVDRRYLAFEKTIEGRLDGSSLHVFAITGEGRSAITTRRAIR